MMNKTIVATQNFFVDTTNPQAGNCQDATFILPQGLLDCAEHQEMRITLNSFSMPKNWYNINQNNSVFYIVGRDGDNITATKVVVEHGNYQYYGNVLPELNNDAESRMFSLADNIEYSIKVALASTHGSPVDDIACTVHYHHQTCLFQIKLDLPYHEYNDGVKFVTFTIPSREQANPANIVSAILNTGTGSHASNIVNSAHPAVTDAAMIGIPSPPSTPTQFFVSVAPGLKADEFAETDDIIQWTYDGVSYWLKVMDVVVKTAPPEKAGGLEIRCLNHGGAIAANNMPVGSRLTFVRPGSATFTEAEGTTLFALNFIDVPHTSGTNINTNFDFNQYSAFVDQRNPYIPQPEGPWLDPNGEFNLLQGYTFETPEVAAGRPVFGVLRWNDNVADTRPIDATITDPPPLRSLEMNAAEGLDSTYTGLLSLEIPETEITWGPSAVAEGGDITEFQCAWDIWNQDVSPERMRGVCFVGQNVDTTTGNSSLRITDIDIRLVQPTGAEEYYYLIVATFQNSHGVTAPGSGNATFSSSIKGGEINEIEDTHQNYWKVLLNSDQNQDLVGRTLQWNSRFNFHAGSSMTPTVSGQYVTTDASTPPSATFYPSPGTLLLTDVGIVVGDDDRRNWFRVGGMGSVGVNDQMLLRESVTKSPGNVQQDAFQSFYEVAGGCYEDRHTVPGDTAAEQFNSLKSLFFGSTHVNAAGNLVYSGEGHFPASLQTMENLYLRTSLNSMNFQSPGFDSGSQQNVASSMVLAKIPVGNTVFAGVSEIAQNAAGDIEVVGKYMTDKPGYTIYYTDNGANNYSIILSQKSCPQLRLFLTDKYGRLLPAVSQEQVNCGQIAFTASLRIDIFELGHI